MVKVKICGITNVEDGIAAAEAGADAIGFVFYKKSKRYVAPPRAKGIIAQLPKSVMRVGVFADENEKNIRYVAKFCNLDILQLHGDESPEFCSRFKDYKVIKAFRIKRKRDLKNVFRYQTWAYLFDTWTKGSVGGSGEKFDWDLVKDLEGLDGEVFLSGGLNEKNVSLAIETVHPDWVDVSSSVEETPGVKSHKRVKKFIEAAKGVK